MNNKIKKKDSIESLKKISRLKFKRIKVKR